MVVSHKALIEAELEQQKKEIIGKLEKGQVLDGTVKNITSYGVFIDLGGVDGLIHITDLSWGRVSDPKDVVELCLLYTSQSSGYFVHPSLSFRPVLARLAFIIVTVDVDYPDFRFNVVR